MSGSRSGTPPEHSAAFPADPRRDDGTGRPSSDGGVRERIGLIAHHRRWLIAGAWHAAPGLVVASVALQAFGSIAYLASTFLLLEFGRDAIAERTPEWADIPLGDPATIGGVVWFVVLLLAITAAGASAWLVAERLAATVARRHGAMLRRRLLLFVGVSGQDRLAGAVGRRRGDRPGEPVNARLLRSIGADLRDVQLSVFDTLLVVAPLVMIAAACGLLAITSPVLALIVVVPTALIYLVPARRLARRSQLQRTSFAIADRTLRRTPPRRAATWGGDSNFIGRLGALDELALARQRTSGTMRSVSLVAFGAGAGLLFAVGLAREDDVAAVLGCLIGLRLVVNGIVQLGSRLARMSRSSQALQNYVDVIRGLGGNEAGALPEFGLRAPLDTADPAAHFVVGEQIVGPNATVLVLATGAVVTMTRLDQVVHALDEVVAYVHGDGTNRFAESLSGVQRIAAGEVPTYRAGTTGDAHLIAFESLVRLDEVSAVHPDGLTVVVVPFTQRWAPALLQQVSATVDAVVVVDRGHAIGGGDAAWFVERDGFVRDLLTADAG